MPFRDAYRKTAENLESLECIDPIENIKSKTHLGAPGNLGLSLNVERVNAESRWISSEDRAWQKTLTQLLHTA